MAKITVLGSGGWGMALALSAHSCGHNVTLWSPFEQEVNLLLDKRTNEKLLKGVYLPEDIAITTDMSVVVGDIITIIATPSIAVREVAKKLKISRSYISRIEKKVIKRLKSIIFYSKKSLHL